MADDREEKLSNDNLEEAVNLYMTIQSEKSSNKIPITIKNELVTGRENLRHYDPIRPRPNEPFDPFSDSPHLKEIFQIPREMVFIGSLAKAKQKGTEEGKWVLVNIQDPNEFTSSVLNRDIWNNKTIQSIINNHFIFCQWKVDSPTSRIYLQFYETFSFPSVSILDPITGERLENWLTFNGAEEMIENLNNFLFIQADSLKKRIKELGFDSPKNPTQDNKPQQLTDLERAIQQSLLDQQKEEEEEKKKKQEEEEKKKQEEDEKDILQEPPENDPDITRIQLRTSDGKRIVRRFRFSDPVSLIAKIFKHEVPDAKSKPFDMIVLPARNSIIEKQDISIKEAGCGNSVIIMEWLD
ncbi:ubx domain-containing protein [Anaeramoeba ignava]|uniref:Ubx domain-containing protein n=1 Tax=Anaeramoeba ignava TaxID=1746090 RepID=A0A9Q0RHB6_ANAIG|nr:ubx domain-containing protein [Anaeramoeba ignava]